MLQKIQALQKRLIAKTEEVVEKDLMIQVWIIWVRVRVRDGVRVAQRLHERLRHTRQQVGVLVRVRG